MAAVILLIENDEADVFLFRRALTCLDFKGDAHIVGSLSEAREYLEGRRRFQSREHYSLPDLIISDIGLRDDNGNIFLEWLRGQKQLRHIPFVFLSGMLPLENVQEIDRSDLKYFRKTTDFEIVLERVRHVLRLLPPG